MIFTIPTSILSTTVNRKDNSTIRPGLLGDSCMRIIGDCEKFMECKSFNNYPSNKTSCQCINGYKANMDRRCSTLIIKCTYLKQSLKNCVFFFLKEGLAFSFCETNDDCGKHLLCDSREKFCVCKSGYMAKEDGACCKMKLIIMIIYFYLTFFKFYSITVPELKNILNIHLR